MLLEQVRAHYLADVRQRKKELVIFVDRHQRRRHVAIHDANIHDRARIDVPIETRSRADRKSTRLNSSHSQISYAVFCLKKKKLINERVIILSQPTSHLRYS